MEKLENSTNSTEALENKHKIFAEIESNLLGIYHLLSTSENNTYDTISHTASEIEGYSKNIHSLDLKNILDNQNYRMESIRYINSIFIQLPLSEFSPEDERQRKYGESISDIYSSIDTIIHEIQEDVYANTDRYDLDKIDLKIDRMGNEFFVANDLFSIFSTIERHGGGMTNYLDIAEKAFLNSSQNIEGAFLSYNNQPETAFLIIKLYGREGGKSKEAIDQFLEKEMELKNFETFENILKGERKTPIEKKIFSLLNNMFAEEFSITKKDFAEGLNYQKGSIRANLDQMSLVENVRPGGVRELNEKFNIYEFRRYTEDMLASQLENENEQLPYGLVVFPRSDYNGAFSHIGNNLYDVFNETKGKHLMRIYEASSKFDIARIFLECDKKYGEKNKVSYLILGGHGQPGYLNLGSHVAGHNKNYIFKHDFLGKGVKKTEKFFIEKPTIALISCSTGADKGLIDNFSKTYDARVVAPKIPTNVKDMHAVYDKEGKIHIDVTWGDENINSLYVSGEKME